MSKKNKAEKTDSKVKIKRWGIGKTLAVVISSVAFVVGAAILGVYLARGFDEETSYPSEISFDVQSNQNYNTQLNRLEITTQEIDAENSFELTITSSTSNITARTVTLDSVSTYAYNTNSGQFARDFLGVSYEEGYVDNGILRFPRQVTIGQPFTVYLSTYRSNDTPDGSYIDQIRGGITTISATSENSALTPEQLTIAVDTPVYATETFVVDQDGNEIPQSNGVFEVTEEEYFYVETKFYPAQSRYLFSTQQSSGATNALSEKTTFYQIDNENITEIYDSATSKHFYAENITEGVHITWFTATNARLQQEIENAVAQVSGLESDEDLYREYILRYSAAASDQTTSEQVLSDNIELNVVQASVETFEVGSAGQTFNLHDQAPLRIYVGDYSEQARDRFLSSVITSRNGAVLNNILQNVVVSFSYNGQDPTASDAAYLTVYGDDANPITIDGVNYYKATFGNPENFGTGYWDLQLLPGYVGRNITMTVSLLLENENGEYVLFANNSGAVQHAITLQTVEHQEEAVSWTDSSNRNITLTYAPNSSQPTPARVSLEGLTEIPEENIYRAPKYFVSFEGLDLEQAVAKAAQMFDGQIEEEFAADYSTNYGSLILVPLTITNDVLIISDVGQFNLYFATTNGFDDNNLYQIVQIVESPIRFDVSKTLYRNSVTNSSVLYQGAGDEEFEAISRAVYLPTASDNTVKDQLQIQFTIAADSVEVFREEFNNGHISLRLLSGESDVTSYFIQTASSLAAETNQDGTLTLTYTLQADNLSSVSQGDMAITQARLDFTDLENSSNNLSWTFENLFSDGGSLALYTPQAQTVGLSMDGISNAYTVSQTLSTNGQIVVEIVETNDNSPIVLTDLISNIAGAITTTDQHDRGDTLANSWYFTSNNAALQITTGNDGINRHGFSFSGEGSAILGISCGAESAANTISFEISATGITGILYDTELDPTAANDLAGRGSIEEEISVEKYGTAGAALTLDNLIKFYVGGGTEETNEYNNITFRLNPTYFTGKDEATLEQLFGQNGMLGLNGEAKTDLSQTALQNISIESISINHNFAALHSITLLATDQSGAVRYSFVLNIRSNIANLSAPTSVDNIDANVATEIETAISYNAKVAGQIYPDSLLSQGYIVPNEAGDGYVVENTERADAVGEIDANDNITFYHIFNSQSQTFSVTFRPEVDNKFAVSRIINFTVKRNISVQNTDLSQVSAFETSQQSFVDFITVGQIEGKSGGFNYSFELPENDNNYIVVSGNGFTIAQNIRFDYGQTSLAQKVIVYVFGAYSLEEAGENYYSQEVEIQIILPDDFWSKVAGSLKGPSTSHQVFNNANNTQMHYMVVVPGQAYTVGSYVSTGTEYSIAPMQRDSQNGNDLSLIYNVFNAAGKYQLRYNSQNAIGDLLYGYGNQNVYTLLRFTSGEKTIDVAVPTIISQIGTTFVSYTEQDPESSLENAMKSAEQLHEERIYTEVNAGEITNLYIADGNPNGIFQPENITFSLSEGAAVGQALPSSLFKNFDVARGELSLNRLSDADAYEEAYLALTYTLRNSSGATRTFNYLLKVNADVTVSQPNYPYSANGSAEYITITSSQQTINLDEEFDETTAQNGHSRFEILENETDIVSDLSHQDSIVSVQVASIDHAFTDPADWQGYINAYITNLNGNSTLVLGYPQTSDRIEIVVRRSYNGGADAGSLSVVGGTIDYHFVLNDDREYTVRAEHNGNTENGLTNYTWVLNDWTDGGQRSQTDPREETRSFFLIEGWQQGDDAHLGSTRPGLLSFNLHEGEEWTVSGNSNYFTATYNNDLTFNFEYDNMSGDFTVTYPGYLSREFNFSSTFFTERGELATINFAFKADAQAETKGKSFEGGQTVVWGDIFTITENGGTGAVSGYTVRIDSFKNGDNVYSAFVRAGDSGLQIASVVQNLTGDLTLTVSWGENKSYTFTIEDFTVQANLTQKDSTAINSKFDAVIGGGTINIIASNLLNGEAKNSTITLSATAEQSAIASITDGETLSIKFNQVGTQTTITLPITITVEPNFSGTSAQTEQVSTQIVVNVTFVIHPSVRIAAVYPSPDGEMLDREYIESGTTFANFGNNFLSHAAVFADGARIKATYAVNADEELVYKTLQEASNEGIMLPLVTKTVIISSITNATVRSGASELKVDSEIGLTDTITFTRGSSGGQSLVDLSISYNNYVITYTIEIRDSSLFTLSVNSASNNISADSSSPYENVYVDKTDSENLFAENRMAKAALSNNAAAGDYYIFFETGNRVYQSKVINLSQNFVSQNQGGSTIYLDLGLNDLGSLTELVDNLGADPTSGQYKAYMFADSYYQNALDSFTDQPPDEEDILNYLTENNSNQNVFSSTFTSFELSSRITLTYAGHDVSYDEYSSMIKYFTPDEDTGKDLGTFSIDTGATLGTAVTGVDHFTFTYLNGGRLVGTQNQIVKSFELKYRYMPDLDIQVGMSGEGSLVEIEVEKPVRIVDAFDITRKSTGQAITMDEMVSGQAGFTLVENGDSNQTAGGQRYVGISYVQYSGDNTVYDIELTGNGAPNEGKDVIFTLTYTVGGFKREFTVTVKVMPDYRFEVNGRVVDLGESLRFSNQDSPYVFEPDDTSALVLAGEDYPLSTTDGEPTTTIEPYLSVVHENSADGVELSVKNFNYTMTVDEMGSYNIKGNISAKLNMNDNGWGSTEDPPTYYKWNKNNDSLVFTGVKAVEFGEQYYHLVAKDDFGYQFDLYFTLSSGNTENPSISTESGALSLTEGEEVAFGAIYKELTVQLEDGGNGEKGGNLVITSPPEKKPSSSDGTQVILIQNMEAWGFDENYYNAGSTFVDGDYFGGTGLAKDTQGYKLGEQNLVGSFTNSSESVNFYLNSTESQKYLKVPNFVDVTIDSIAYYYQDQQVGTEDYSSSAKKIASASGLTNARGGDADGGYYDVSQTKLTLPTIYPSMTWIYGTGNSVQVTMVVTLKYTPAGESGNTEYYQMQQQITLSKTSQITAERQYAADNTAITLKDYISVTDNAAPVDDYTIYDDTLAVAVEEQSTTRFDLTYTPTDNNEEQSQTVTLSAGNAATTYKSLYYSSLSGAFNQVLTGGKITITPHDDNATFYYGNNENGGNEEVLSTNKTSFTKVADVNYFRVETFDGSAWSNYTSNIEGTPVDNYDPVNGGYDISLTDENGTITISASDLVGSHENFRISYNGVYYYPQLQFDIAPITTDYITVASHYQLSSGEMPVNQYYVISWSGKAYRYTHQFSVTGTFASIESPTSIYTLPLGPSDPISISTWAEGVTYTQVDKGDLIGDNSLANYSGDNLYFNITSDGTSGGTGLASIDAETGAITLQEGFTASHYVTVQIYQKVSGIDGSWGGTELSQMQLLKTIRVYPASSTQTSEGNVTLTEILPKGTYYSNASKTISIPPQTSAELVVYNGDAALNRISLENDSEQEEHQSFTIAALLGYKAVQNYSSLKVCVINSDGDFVSGFKLDEETIEEGGRELSLGEAITTDNITFGQDENFAAKTYLILTSDETSPMLSIRTVSYQKIS